MRYKTSYIKLLIWCALGFGLGLLLGCTNQKPVSQAPVWSITITDNSQTVIGDSNTTKTDAKVISEQIAKPNADAKSDNATSNMWIFWIILATAGIIVLYFAYRKWGSSIINWIKRI